MHIRKILLDWMKSMIWRLHSFDSCDAHAIDVTDGKETRGNASGDDTFEVDVIERDGSCARATPSLATPFLSACERRLRTNIIDESLSDRDFSSWDDFSLSV